MRAICSIVLGLFPLFLFSQNIEFLYKNNEYKPVQLSEEFYYLHPGTKDSTGIRMAEVFLTIAKSGDKENLSKTFYALWKEANKAGANAFFIKESIHDEQSGTYKVSVDLYDLSPEEIDLTMSHYPENRIIIFGNTNTNDEKKGKGFKLNSAKVTIMPYTYIEHSNEPGNETSISIGGLFGSSIKIESRQGRLPLFYSLGGVALVGASYTAPGAIGISVSTGSVIPVDMNFGFFLKDVLDEVR